MGRERKTFKRKSGFRDATLFVIATEGENTEPDYFEALKNHNDWLSPKVHIEIIPSKNGLSSVSYVLGALSEFKKNYRIREDDELWIVFDRDQGSLGVKQLKECIQQCKQKRIHYALSNPCFELWILLHYICVDTLSAEEKELLRQNKKRGKRTQCEQKIIELLGSYNKSNLHVDKLLNNTILAINRAKILSKNNSINLFNKLGTNIYLLIERLINHSN